MSEYIVFRDGVKWYFVLDGVRSEAWESKDQADLEGKRAVIKKRKEQYEKDKPIPNAKSEKERSKG
jgi:hypothetical protein